ncbi:hypothetical protein ACRJ4W_50650 [Streptomyces sp. GLT-R25]
MCTSPPPESCSPPLGGTFASGALEAWAVDETGAKDLSGLDRLFAQGKIAENAGLVLGTLTGAALGTLDLALPQIVAGLTCALAAVLSLRLMTGRPDPDRPQAAPGRREAFAPRLRESFGEVMTGTRLTLRGDKVLIALILAAALLWLFRGIPGVQWTVVYEGLVGGNLLVLGAMRSVGSSVGDPPPRLDPEPAETPGVRAPDRHRHRVHGRRPRTRLRRRGEGTGPLDRLLRVLLHGVRPVHARCAGGHE